MAKKGGNTAAIRLEQAILAWASALLGEEKPVGSTTASLPAWICVSQLLPELSTTASAVLWPSFTDNQLPAPPRISALILGGFLANLPWSSNNKYDPQTFAQQLVDHHLQLTTALDPEETGLLDWPELSDKNHLSSIQAAWIWSTTELLQLADVTTGDLPQLHEIYIYETDFQLWEEDQGCYGMAATNRPPDESWLVGNVLSLFAGIPDQERAEKVLRWLQAQLPPWQNNADAKMEWLENPLSYLLYLALNRYEMMEEAEELKEYIQKHLTPPPENDVSVCLRWLWR